MIYLLNTFRGIFDYITKGQYPNNRDSQYKLLTFYVFLRCAAALRISFYRRHFSILLYLDLLTTSIATLTLELPAGHQRNQYVPTTDPTTTHGKCQRPRFRCHCEGPSFNVATGEYSPGNMTNNSRLLSWVLVITINDGAYAGQSFEFAAAQTEMTIYGFAEGDSVCGVAIAVDGAESSDPSCEACALAAVSFNISLS